MSDTAKNGFFIGLKLNITDTVISLLAVFGGVGVIVYGMDMKYLASGHIGSGLFPIMCGIMLIIFGTALLVKTVRRVPSIQDETEEEMLAKFADGDASNLGYGGSFSMSTESQSRLMLNGVIIIACIVFYLIFAEIFGFIICLFLMLSTIMIMLKETWWKALLYAGVITAIIYLSFEKGLLVQLPDGILGF